MEAISIESVPGKIFFWLCTSLLTRPSLLDLILLPIVEFCFSDDSGMIRWPESTGSHIFHLVTNDLCFNFVYLQKRKRRHEKLKNYSTKIKYYRKRYQIFLKFQNVNDSTLKYLYGCDSKLENKRLLSALVPIYESVDLITDT